jgi:hypothetical protein
MANQQALFSLLAFFLFCSCVQTTNWQGIGNLTADNLTYIWGTINGNIGAYTNGATLDAVRFATNLSNTFTSQWDVAWNVFVFELKDPTVDAIVYGYAFRDHWMWYNGFVNGATKLAFVIWKDYNCITWHSIRDIQRQTIFTTGDTNAALYSAVQRALAFTTF